MTQSDRTPCPACWLLHPPGACDRGGLPHPQTPPQEATGADLTAERVQDVRLTVRAIPGCTEAPRGSGRPIQCASTLCATPPRATAGRSNLCPPCEDRLADDLRTIAETWADATAAISPRSIGQDDRVDASPTPGLAIDERVSATLAAVTADVAFYARIVITERELTRIPGTTTPVLAAWLARTHVPWLAAHDDPEVSASIADDMRRHRHALWRAAYPTGARRIAVPLRCDVAIPVDPEQPDGETRQCGGLMHAMVGLPVEPDLVCDEDPAHRAPPSTWKRPTWQRHHWDRGATRALALDVSRGA